MEKYKVIKEYDRFYLCEHEKGYKECFNKIEYKPDEEDYIIKKEQTNLEYIKQVPMPDKLEKDYKNFFKVGV